MIKNLLAIAAGATLLSLICFGIASILGGLPDWPRAIRAADGPEVTRALPWTGGGRLDVDYPADITYTQGPQPRFAVTGPKEVVDALVLQDGVLRGPDRPHFSFGHRRRADLRIEIVSPDTHEFHLNGAQKLQLMGFDQDSLILNSAGAADIEGQGRAKRLEASVAGAGDLELGQLAVDDAVVSISGAGQAEIDPHVSADISISGAGHVDLKTRPPMLQTHISGFGSVDPP